MAGDTIRGIVCWLVLLLHVGTIAISPVLIIDFNEALDVILILMPLTGLYVGVVVNFYTNQDIQKQGDIPLERFSLQFSAITIFLVLTFSVAIIGAQYLYYIGKIDTVSDLKRAAGIIDTGLGVYSGFLVKRLFRS